MLLDLAREVSFIAEAALTQPSSEYAATVCALRMRESRKKIRVDFSKFNDEGREKSRS